MSSATVRTTCTVLVAGGPRRRGRPVEALAGDLVPAQREVRRATSATAGPRSRVPTSCQPRRRRAGWSLESKRSPAWSVRSMPLTKASSPSMTIVFSWWQWNGCSRGSASAADARAARERARRRRATSRARRVEGGHRRARPHEHADVDALGQLGEQRAERRRGGSPRDELEVRREVPAGDVDEVARVRACASAIAGSACAPSTSTSSAQPSRGGGSPAAQRPSSGGSSARSQPRRRRRRRCLARDGGLDGVADGGVGVAQDRDRHRVPIFPRAAALNACALPLHPGPSVDPLDA